jgi:D-inositol-3-phosphate glycosyltransferase
VAHRPAGGGAMKTDVGLLTGGSDKPYAAGLAAALSAQKLCVDFIGSDELDCAAIRELPGLKFLNLRGDQREDASALSKLIRVSRYYARLVRYAALGDAPILHILWNNRFEWLDRTILMAFYRAVGKRIVLTAHNVNAAQRDARDTWLNRLSLRIQYRLCDHLFVHTEAMRTQLVREFGISVERISVIPFGLNETIPVSGLGSDDAKRRFGLAPDQKTLLCFGQIAPYKGLEYLVEALAALAKSGEDIRLIIAGKIKRGNDEYWAGIERAIAARGIDHLIVRRIQFIPDEEVEVYFKAADAVVLPYVSIFQSGVPFLAFSFGVPVIATDVGSLRDDVGDDTGVLCRPCDPEDLARATREFFRGPLFVERESRRRQIRAFAERHHSWARVGESTQTVYARLAAAHESRLAGAHE